MRVALINPNWSFGGSIYFGCREPHLPLEYGYTSALLEQAGHEVRIVDGQLDTPSGAWTGQDPAPQDAAGLPLAEIVGRVAAFDPDLTVITTAPSYLFWRCAPPELRVPIEVVRALRAARVGGALVGVGPHGSTTPPTTLRKLGVDLVVIGECEEVVARLADCFAAHRTEYPDGETSLAGVDLHRVPSICYWPGGATPDLASPGLSLPHDTIPHRDTVPVMQGTPHASSMAALPALRWPAALLARHSHHHHRFDITPTGPGAEMEYSRGCPYRCSFCAKENFRNKYRKRPLNVVLDELDGLIAAGVVYIYFIDEIFLPDRPLLEALCLRPIQFGVQTRIDLWDPELLALLGRAGCVSIEAGVESISEEGRQLLDKRCKLSTEQLSDLLIAARLHVPFVQANLLDAGTDDPAAIEDWRAHLLGYNVWANKPVPLFPYPGSPDYTRLWGLPDDHAWERAHAHYLRVSREFSDIQEEQPSPLPQLEALAAAR